MSIGGYNWGRWLNGPLPFYDDPATQQATQRPPGGYPTAQDTGWSSTINPIPTAYQPTTLGGFTMPPYTPGTGAPAGDTYDGFPLPPFPGSGQTLGGTGWSAPSTAVPATAPSTTGGAAGGTTAWDIPEWSYGGNQKGGGTYNPQTGQWDNGAPLAAGADVFGARLPVGYDSAQDRGGLGLNGQNVETFWSRMLRFAKDSGLPPDQAMRAALDRIRRDNGGTLAGTGFQEGGGASGAPVTTATTTGGGGSTGGKTVDPDNGTGMPIPGGAPIPGPVPGAPAPMGPLNSLGGAELYQDPKLAWRYILRQAGADPDYEGTFSNFMRQEYMPAMVAYMNAKLTGMGRKIGATGEAGKVGMDQIGSLLGGFGGLLGGNDLYTQLAQAGQQGIAAGGGMLNTASSQDAENFMRQMLGLTGMGNGPLAQSAQQYLTNSTFGRLADQNLGQVKQTKFGDFMDSSGFLDRLRQFGLLR